MYSSQERKSSHYLPISDSITILLTRKKELQELEKVLQSSGVLKRLARRVVHVAHRQWAVAEGVSDARRAWLGR